MDDKKVNIEITSDVVATQASGTQTHAGATIESVLITGGMGAPGKTPVKGVDYFDGRDVELRNNGTHIQWRAVGDTEWIDIVDVAELEGTAGREMQIQTADGFIQYRMSSDEPWANLIAIPTGDMSISVYDPTNKSADVYDRTNHTGEQPISTVTGLQTALDSKATPAQVSDAISSIVGAAPDTLNTLSELSDALGDDPNFATTITTQIAGKANTVHSHTIADTSGLQTALDGKASTASVAGKANTVHTHAQSDVTNLTSDLAGKAPLVHTHDDRYYTEAEMDALLAGLTPTAHTHAIAEVTGLQGALDGKADDADLDTKPAYTEIADVGFTGSYTDLINKPAPFDPGTLASVATTGAYNDLTGKPTLGTAASADTSAFATSAQGAVADSAVQPGELAPVATSGQYSDLTGTPSLAAVATTGSYNDLTDTPVGGGSGVTSIQAGPGITVDSSDPESPIVSANAATVTKASIGLGNVDNTSDASKPISTATQAALNGKAASVHSHFIENIVNLNTELAGKVNGTVSITAGTTPPASPSLGDLWVDLS